VQRLLEHEDEVALAIDGQFAAGCSGFDGQGVRNGAQQTGGGFAQQGGEVVGRTANPSRRAAEISRSSLFKACGHDRDPEVVTAGRSSVQNRAHLEADSSRAVVLHPQDR
jgi:hypothetical protein